jgi:hypothetical protein
MSNEISRRDSLKLVLASAPAAALAGGVAFWPDEALSWPVAEPAILTLNGKRGRIFTMVNASGAAELFAG